MHIRFTLGNIFSHSLIPSDDRPQESSLHMYLCRDIPRTNQLATRRVGFLFRYHTYNHSEVSFWSSIFPREGAERTSVWYPWLPSLATHPMAFLLIMDIRSAEFFEGGQCLNNNSWIQRRLQQPMFWITHERTCRIALSERMVELSPDSARYWQQRSAVTRDG